MGMEFKFFKNHEIEKEDLNVLIDLTKNREIQWVEGPEYYTFHARPKNASVFIDEAFGPIVALHVPKEIIIACEPDHEWRTFKVIDEKGWSYSIEKLSNSELKPLIDKLHEAVLRQTAP